MLLYAAARAAAVGTTSVDAVAIVDDGEHDMTYSTAYARVVRFSVSRKQNTFNFLAVYLFTPSSTCLSPNIAGSLCT